MALSPKSLVADDSPPVTISDKAKGLLETLVKGYRDHKAAQIQDAEIWKQLHKDENKDDDKLKISYTEAHLTLEKLEKNYTSTLEKISELSRNDLELMKAELYMLWTINNNWILKYKQAARTDNNGTLSREYQALVEEALDIDKIIRSLSASTLRNAQNARANEEAATYEKLRGMSPREQAKFLSDATPKTHSELIRQVPGNAAISNTIRGATRVIRRSPNPTPANKKLPSYMNGKDFPSSYQEKLPPS